MQRWQVCTAIHRRKKLRLKKKPNNEVYVGIIIQNSLGTVILQKTIYSAKSVNAMLGLSIETLINEATGMETGGYGVLS